MTVSYTAKTFWNKLYAWKYFCWKQFFLFFKVVYTSIKATIQYIRKTITLVFHTEVDIWEMDKKNIFGRNRWNSKAIHYVTQKQIPTNDAL